MSHIEHSRRRACSRVTLTLSQHEQTDRRGQFNRLLQHSAVPVGFTPRACDARVSTTAENKQGDVAASPTKATLPFLSWRPSGYLGYNARRQQHGDGSRQAKRDGGTAARHWPEPPAGRARTSCPCPRSGRRCPVSAAARATRPAGAPTRPGLATPRRTRHLALPSRAGALARAREREAAAAGRPRASGCLIACFPLPATSDLYQRSFPSADCCCCEYGRHHHRKGAAACWYTRFRQAQDFFRDGQRGPKSRVSLLLRLLSGTSCRVSHSPVTACMVSPIHPSLVGTKFLHRKQLGSQRMFSRASY